MNLLFAAFDPVEFGLRWLHVMSAVIAAGGAFFQWLALHPTLATVETSVRVDVRERVASRWRGVVFLCIAILLVTGLANFVLFRAPAFRGASNAGIYHALFGVKFLLALMAFHAAAVLALPGEKGARYRDRAAFWLNYLVALFAIILTLGVVLGRIAPAAGVPASPG